MNCITIIPLLILLTKEIFPQENTKLNNTITTCTDTPPNIYLQIRIYIDLQFLI